MNETNNTKWRQVTKRRQCNGSRRRQSTASVIETRFTEALRRISRVATREPIVPDFPFTPRPRFQNSQQIILVSGFDRADPSRERNEKFSRTRRARDRSEGQTARLREPRELFRETRAPGKKISVRVRISKSIATRGSFSKWQWRDSGLRKREPRTGFSGAMTRSKTQRALKPLVTYVHARCGRY